MLNRKFLAALLLAASSALALPAISVAADGTAKQASDYEAQQRIVSPHGEY
jgi:hypothetical protein